MQNSLDVRGTLLTSALAGARMGLAIRVASVALFAVLTAAAAQVSIPLPFTPVPLTLQPMVVLLGGAVLGARLGMAIPAPRPAPAPATPPSLAAATGIDCAVWNCV